MKVLILTLYGRLGASSRLRMWQFIPWLEREGIEYRMAPLIDDNQLRVRYEKGSYALPSLLRSYLRRVAVLAKRNRFDVIWVEKEALPWLPLWFEKLFLRGVNLVVDYDDAIFHKYDLHSNAVVRKLLGTRIDGMMAAANAVTVGNGYLAQRSHASGARHTEVIPTVIDLERYSGKLDTSAESARLRIVWIGSPSTTRYLGILRDPLASLAREFNFTLRVIGDRCIDLPGVDVETVAWREDTEVHSMSECHIGVMPLSDTPWERGKCGYKLIQYMACGLPVVASPVGANMEIVRPGENGFLADGTEQWVDCLGRLLRNASLRRKMGDAGRRRVEDEFCSQRVASKILAVLRSAALGKSDNKESMGLIPIGKLS
ncbi:MAG: glycosyltransferase family 4 protein [Fibrobacterota bacterium]|nr:glycosyltransferase family 4 protein [Fibrobacterota bacterium]